MKELIIGLVPDLKNYPLFLGISEMLFALFFGGIFFTELWGLLHGYRKH